MKIYTELYLNRNCKSDNFFSEKCDNVSEDVAFVHDSKTTVSEITAARNIGWLKVSDTVSANSEKTPVSRVLMRFVFFKHNPQNI